MAIIGKRNTLAIVRASTPGLYLDGGELGEILLPRRYITSPIVAKGAVDVFVYLDSEDRLVATTEIPHATVGEFANLKVISLHREMGAFLDWGLAKDLLLPFREQEVPVRAGQRVTVYVYLDEKTNRIACTTRLHRHLNRQAPAYAPGQPVALLIVNKTPLGYTAIVENAHHGLLYHDKLPAALEPGGKLQGFVRAIRAGGKIDLSLDASGYERVNPLSEKILAALKRNQGQLDFDDSSSPEAIREVFGSSKKAFKQALGALYKSRRILFCKPGIALSDPQSPTARKQDHPPANTGRNPASVRI